MQSYLPRESGPSSGYSEGGGLYALGLIHANHGANIIDYLLQQLKDAQNENVRHGGCLGLGLAAMGTHRQDVYEQLKFNLYQDDAVTGEAAGIAMGMVMLGSKNASAIEDMVAVSTLFIIYISRNGSLKKLNLFNITTHGHENASENYFFIKMC